MCKPVSEHLVLVVVHPIGGQEVLQHTVIIFQKAQSQISNVPGFSCTNHTLLPPVSLYSCPHTHTCRSQVKQAQQEAEYNPANFGDSRRGRLCICEVPGQVPCPSKVPIKNVEHKWHNKNDGST